MLICLLHVGCREMELHPQQIVCAPMQCLLCCCACACCTSCRLLPLSWRHWPGTQQVLLQSAMLSTLPILLSLQLLCQLLLLFGELSSDSPLLLRLQAADAVKETMAPTKPLEDIPDINQLQTSGSSATGWWKIEQPPNTICHRSTSCEK